MTRTERLLRLARLRGDRAAETIMLGNLVREHDRKRMRRAMVDVAVLVANGATPSEAVDWTEAELRAAWGDR